MISPEFSESKSMHLKPNIVDIPTKDTKPVYDLILGTETLGKLGVILNFELRSITLDQCKFDMVENTSSIDQKTITLQFIEHLEPTSMNGAMQCKIGILDAV